MDESIKIPITANIVAEPATAGVSGRSLQSIARYFVSSEGLVHQGKWLLVNARNVPRLQGMGIMTLGDPLGDSDASAVALAVKPWLMKRPPPAGNPVGVRDGLCVFKSDKAEGFGTDAVYIAFGKRPEKCVADEYLSASTAESSNSSRRGGEGGGTWSGGVRCRELDNFVQLPDEMNENEADRALLEAADEIVLNGRRRTRQTQAMHDDGATEMGDGRRPAAKCHSQGRFVSYAGSSAELEKKLAKLAAEVKKAGLRRSRAPRRSSGSRTRPSRLRGGWRRCRRNKQRHLTPRHARRPPSSARPPRS